MKNGRARLKKHGRNIRYLSVTSIAFFMNASAEGSTITRLQSLSAQGISIYDRFEEEAVLFKLPVLAGMEESDRATLEQQQALISSYIRSPAFQDALELDPRKRLKDFIRGIVASQRFWLLILQNPDLENLRLGHHLRRPLQKILGELPGLHHYTYCLPASSGSYFIPNDLEPDQALPRLLSLEIRSYGPLRLASLYNQWEFLPILEEEDSTAGKQESLHNKPHSRLRGLHIVAQDQEITTAFDGTIVELVVPVVPFLAEITLRILMPATVAALVKHRLHLETVKVLDDVHSNKVEMICI
ncbi:hypothetical protein K457DRAFT_17814 [Linnemannia elongata AG-77]|uniref:Uncharacterized protein n=1 Tax=Linnemannia elongata AG-77 TaxID=1314771 RepID=A0A197K186_9FUNG|nr:hypothetical protein K457DRAFT_17814 [Linnemannia elongata AG-77]